MTRTARAGFIWVAGVLLFPAWGADTGLTAPPAAPAAPERPAAPAEPLPITADQKGLLVALVEMPAAPSASQEEMTLGIKPYPGVIRKRLTWYYVPEKYDRAVPGPLLLALHPRARVSAFSSSIQLVKPEFLDRWCKATLDTWKDLADEKGAILVVPLGDPDPLTMGLTWHAGDRSEMFSALVAHAAKTHAFDPKRVYAAGSGDGAHALVASAVHKPGLFAAVAACNPPLLEGPAKRQTPEGPMLLPETVDDWVQAGGIQTPLYVLAGEQGKREFMSGRAPRDVNAPQMTGPNESGEEGAPPPPPKSDKPRRYVDHESVLLADHMERMFGKLKSSPAPMIFERVGGMHRDPFPAAKARAAWDWFAKFPPAPDETKKPE